MAAFQRILSTLNYKKTGLIVLSSMVVFAATNHSAKKDLPATQSLFMNERKPDSSKSRPWSSPPSSPLARRDSRNVLKVEFEAGKSSVLGKGTYGIVRTAREVVSGKPVALKIVNKGTRSLAHEVEALRRIKEHGGHPNVVSFIGVVEIEGDSRKCGLVFELLEGGELYESLVKHGAYSENRASAVTRQVASALAFLHEDCKIAHADLKPENLLLRTAHENGAIAICDFGSAVELDEQGTFEFSDKRLLGTVAYAAPELLAPQYADVFHRRALSERASSAVDVWSLGCILYVVLSGQHPFDPDNELTTDEELAKVILKGDVDFGSPIWNDVSDSAKDLIKHMLQVDPAKRITAREVLQHDWIRLPQRKSIISGSDVRLIGYLRTQKRLQDHVFHLMLDGSLKSGGRRSSVPTKEDEQGEEESAYLEEIFKSIDLEGKGFITKNDLERTLSKPDTGRVSQNQGDESSSKNYTISNGSEADDDDKLYYASLNGLLGCGERVKYSPGSIVFEKGDSADCFYFIDRGRVEVLIGSENKANVFLGAGDFFGETALIKNQPRNATVRVGARGAELIRFSRDDFDRLMAGSDTAFKLLDEHVRKRTVEHVKFIFSSLFHDKETVHLSYGDVLLKRGEPSDSMFYILDGEVEVIAPTGQIMARRKEGETVGELGLVTGQPRSMDIKCGSVRGCAFKKLDRNDLSRLLQFSPLAHSELQKTLSSRGVGSSSTRETSDLNNSRRESPLLEHDLRRRWTIAQGNARQKSSKKP